MGFLDPLADCMVVGSSLGYSAHCKCGYVGPRLATYDEAMADWQHHVEEVQQPKETP